MVHIVAEHRATLIEYATTGCMVIEEDGWVERKEKEKSCVKRLEGVRMFSKQR